MALAHRTVQNIPACLRREPITVLHPASIGIAHTIRVGFEVICLGANLLGHGGWAGAMDRSASTSFSISPGPAGASGELSSKLSVGLPPGDRAGEPPPKDVGELGRDQQTAVRQESVRRLDF